MSSFITDSWADIDDTPTISVDDNTSSLTPKVEAPVAPPTNAVEKKTLDLEAPQPKATDVTPSEVGKTAILPEETKEVPAAQEEANLPKAPPPITIEDLLNEPSDYFRIFVTGVHVANATAKEDVEDVIGNFFLSKGTIPVDVKVPLAATAEKPDEWKIPKNYNNTAVVCFVHPDDVENAIKNKDQWRMQPLKPLSVVEVPREGNAAHLSKQNTSLANKLSAWNVSDSRDGNDETKKSASRFNVLAPETSSNNNKPRESEEKQRKSKKNKDKDKKKEGSSRPRSEKPVKETKTSPKGSAGNEQVTTVTEDGFTIVTAAKASRAKLATDKEDEEKVKGSKPVDHFDVLADGSI